MTVFAITPSTHRYHNVAKRCYKRLRVCLHHSGYLLDTAIRIKTKAGTFTNLPTVQPKALSLQGSAARWFRASGMWPYIGKESRRVPALLAMEGKMAGPILNRQFTDSVTRRGVLIGTAASLLCTPAIVRASSLMPVRGLIMCHSACNFDPLSRGIGVQN